MGLVGFEALPADARVWIFAAGRALGAEEQARLLAQVDGFIGGWAAHDTPLTAGRELRYDRFLLVAVDQRLAGPSGCSIDALLRKLKQLEGELGVELVNHAPVLFRAGREIRRVRRDEFAALASAGEVSPETTVFDNSLTRLGDVRDGRWETPAANAWHARAFFRTAAAG